MTKKQLFIPIMRVIAVLYFIYKMAFSDPKIHWTSLFEITDRSPGEMVGKLIGTVIFSLFFLAFAFYQIRQTSSGLKLNSPKRDRLRLISIIWSILFYPLAFSSLFNVNFEHPDFSIIIYLTHFYTIATFIGTIAGIIVVVKDIQIIIRLKKNKKALRQNV